jgi:hypothetical protein
MGVALGFWARGPGEASARASALQTIGTIFVQLLRALVPPDGFARSGEDFATEARDRREVLAMASSPAV